MPDNVRLLRLLPKILRAREFHLYTEGGKRLTDLWLHGGKALLGHKSAHVLAEFKNSGERGLFTPLPHPMEKRFFKALEIFFPGRVFRLYADEGSLRFALEKAGFLPREELQLPFADPAFPGNAANGRGVREEKISLWRPAVKTVNTPVLIPVLPWSLGPDVLVLEKDIDALFPQSEIISPVLLAPACRALHNLAAALKAESPGRFDPRYRGIDKSLKSKNCLWRRLGIYLTLSETISDENYSALFGKFLEGGFLLPPSQREPLILPAFMSRGEETKLSELLV